MSNAPDDLPPAGQSFAYLGRWLAAHMVMLLVSTSFRVALFMGAANLVNNAMQDELTWRGWVLNGVLVVLTAINKGVQNEPEARARAGA